MKNTKRIIAAVLTVIMMISMLPSNAFATESSVNDAAESAVEAVSVPGEVQEIESTVEDVSEEYLETSEAVQESSEEVQTVEDAEPAEAEETEQTAEIPAEETVLYPEMDLEGKAGRVTVKVHAPEGALPAGTELKVEKVKKADVEDLVNEATEGEVSDFVAVDVSFHVKGQEGDFEPLKEVKVEFVLEDNVLPEAESYDVIHVAVDEKGNETPEVIEEKKIVDEITAEGGTISQKDFSVFIIAASGVTSNEDTDTEKAVETYIFYFYDADENTWVPNADFTQAVKVGDTLNEPEVPEGVNYIFKGWYEYKPETGVEEPFNGFGTISAVASSRAERHIRAVVEKAYYVVFHDSNDEASIIKTVKAAEGDTVSTDGVEAQSVSNQEIFDGWATAPNSSVTDEVESVTLPAETETGNVDLYPVFVEGYVLTFDANDENTGTASSTPTQYLKEGEQTTKPSDPRRSGYKFDGWYLDPDGNTAFEFGSSLTGDLTVYAKWSPAQTTYRVVVWRQSVFDDKNATDNQKTWDFAESSELLTAVTGTRVNAPSSYTNKTGGKYTGFRYNDSKTDKNVEVEADGTTIVNVYYDRVRITYNFDAGFYDGFYVRARGQEKATHYFTLLPPWFVRAGTGLFPNRTPRYIYVTSRTMDGLYGQPLSQYGYYWPDGKWNYSGGTLTFAGEFKYWNGTNATTNFSYQNDTPDYYIMNYSEREDGSYELTDAVNGWYTSGYWPNQYSTFNFEEKYPGFAPAKYYLSSDDDPDDVMSLPDNAKNIPSSNKVTVRGQNLFIFHERKEHTISFFYTNGGTAYPQATKKYGADLSQFASAESAHADPEHYTFDGWYADQDLSAKVNFNGMKMPDNDLAVYAGFKKVEYEVKIDPAEGTFADDGTNVARELSVKYDEKVAEPVVSREDYILTGWTATYESGDQGPWTFNNDTVKENLTITAGWYYTKDIKLQYYNGASLVASESYRDGAEATLIHPDEIDDFEAPDNKFFKGWEIDGTLYSSGAMYTVSAANMEDDGTVKAYAVYGDLLEQEEATIVLKTTKEGTSITDGTHTAVTGDAGITLGPVGVNKDEFALSAVSGSHDEGLYELIGWSKTEDGNVLFKTTDKVAVDNKNLTDGKNVLYAVWQAKFGIYHSSDGEVEVLPIPDKPVDLAAKVRSGYMYGGYYSYVEEAEDGDKHPHRGDAITDVPGTRLNPNKDKYTVYYLKEVSTSYLAPQVFAVWYNYSNHKLTQLHLMTNVDEAEYNDYGVALSINGAEATDCSSRNVDNELVYNNELILTQKKSDGSSTEKTYSPNDLFGTEKAYFAAIDKSEELLTDGNEFSMIGYYVTPDGVRVTGRQKWSISLRNLDKTAVVRTIENPGWDYAKPATLGSAAPAAAPAGRRMIRTYRVVQDPDSFNITKVDGGAEYVQKVNPGDNTGILTYEGKAGYIFAGWYSDKSFKNVADLSNVQSNMTVYAKYEQESRVKLTFSKKSVKKGTVTLKATLKITDMEDIEDVSVVCSTDNQYEVSFGSPAESKSGTLITETYTGTVVMPGLKSGNTFTAVISYTTPDGTNVSLSAKNCKYSLGVVTVK